MTNDPNFWLPDHCSVCKVVSNRLIEDDRGIFFCSYCKEMEEIRLFDKQNENKEMEVFIEHKL